MLRDPLDDPVHSHLKRRNLIESSDYRRNDCENASLRHSTSRSDCFDCYFYYGFVHDFYCGNRIYHDYSIVREVLLGNRVGLLGEKDAALRPSPVSWWRRPSPISWRTSPVSTWRRAPTKAIYATTMIRRRMARPPALFLAS